jgi:membrane protein YdbS with pleckstrin-like domain
MKQVCWKLIALITISIMTIGFVVSLYGIHDQNKILSYTGLTVMALTCVGWWIWVMLVIKRMWDYTQSAAQLAIEVRQGIKEVRRLIREYKNLID